MQKLRINAVNFAFFVVLFFLTLTGCDSSSTFQSVPENLKDRSILTDEPCKAPCWHNLLPDKSSKQDTLNVLTNLAFIDSASIRTQNANWWGATPEEPIAAILILANCKQPTEVQCVEILVVEDKVKYISVFPNYKLTVDEVVIHLGKPNYVSTQPWGAECLGCILKISWLQSSMEISLTRNDRRCRDGYEMCQVIRDGGKIPIGLEVEEITYLGSVPSYRQTPMQDYDIPWPGLADP